MDLVTITIGKKHKDYWYIFKQHLPINIAKLCLTLVMKQSEDY